MTRIHIATSSEPHGSNVLTQGRDVIASHASQQFGGGNVLY